MSLNEIVDVETGSFRYVAATFTFSHVGDSTVYHVYYGAQGDIVLGCVVALGDEWFATSDGGTWAALRWCGPFTQRAEAALCLLGGRLERTRPAVVNLFGDRRLLRERPTRMPADPELLPEARRSELAFRRAVPRQVGEFEILHVEHWWPGGDARSYAGAIVVTRRGEADYTTHWLHWAHDNDNTPWTLNAGNYGFDTFEHARWDAKVRASA